MADAIAVLCLIIASTWQPKQHDIHIFKPTRKSFQFQATHFQPNSPTATKKNAHFLCGHSCSIQGCLRPASRHTRRKGVFFFWLPRMTWDFTELVFKGDFQGNPMISNEMYSRGRLNGTCSCSSNSIHFSHCGIN